MIRHKDDFSTIYSTLRSITKIIKKTKRRHYFDLLSEITPSYIKKEKVEPESSPEASCNSSDGKSLECKSRHHPIHLSMTGSRTIDNSPVPADTLSSKPNF